MRKPHFEINNKAGNIQVSPGWEEQLPAVVEKEPTVLVSVPTTTLSLSRYCREILQVVMNESLKHEDKDFTLLCPDETYIKMFGFQYNMWYEADHLGENQ